MSYLHRLPRPWRGYAGWTRRQASAVNCGPGPAGAGLLGLGVAALVVAAYWAVIWPVLVIIFWVAVSCLGAALLGTVAGGIAAAAAAARRRALAAAPPARAPAPTLAGDHALPWSGPDPVPARPPALPAPEPPEVAIARNWGMNPPRQLPDADAEVPVAPDNAAATDPGTAGDLAAVLARTGQWRRSHP
jgi:hypothetical protein